MTDPTDAEIQAGADAIARSWRVLSPTSRRHLAKLMLRAVLPDHDARVRADERQRMEAAGWRPPIRHGDPHMLAAVYGYELGEQEERRRLAELLAAVDRALAKARREYVRSAERDGQDQGPEGECWAEFEALADIARQHATTTEGDHHD